MEEKVFNFMPESDPVGEQGTGGLRELPCPMVWGIYEQKSLHQVQANDAFYQLLGFTDQECQQLERTLTGPILAPEDERLVRDSLEEVAKTGNPVSLVHSFCIPGKRKLSVAANVGRLSAKDRRCIIVAAYTDNTSAKEKEIHLEKQVQMDLMTGLYNKVYAEHLIKKKLQEEKLQNACLIMIDVDNFKTVNDTFGHLFGDVVIRDIAQEIITVFPPDTNIVGRIGGDEFLIMTQNVTSQQLQVMLDALKQQASYEYLTDDGVVTVTISAGFTICEEEHPDYQTMFKRADTAMYYSKEYGKKQYSEYRENMAPIRSRKRTSRRKNDDFYTMKDCDMEFVASSYHLLADSKYIESSISMVMRKVAEKYQLYSAYAYEYDAGMDGYYRQTGWNEESKADEGAVFIERQWVRDYFGDQQAIVFEDDSHTKGNGHGIVCCKMPEKQEVDGFFIFTSQQQRRVWSDYEVSTFEELSKAVTIFYSLDKERRKEQAQKEQIASRDQVTGILNMKSFEKKLNEELKEDHKGRVRAVVYLDIEHFAYVNEKYGFDAGDEVLRILTKTLCWGGHVLLAARAYCDSFQILMESISKEAMVIELEYGMQSFTRVLRQKFPFLDLALKVGMYYLTREDRFAYTAIENANLARKFAKREEGNQVQEYHRSLRKDMESGRQITEELESAIEQDQLQLYLQPKFSLSTKEVIGLEAFGRWNTRQGLIRKPKEYLPALRLSGKLGRLDMGVLELVVRTLRKWQDTGRKLYPISVNMVGSECCKPGFLSQLLKLVKRYDVATKWIEIEVVCDDMEKYGSTISNVMDQLHKYGFQIGVDNFGTGYEAMKLIMDRRFDVIKVERAFLQKTENQTDRRNYMNYLNELAETQQQQVVFIGAETSEQAQELLECGYESVQGYFFEKIISLEQFECTY